ncbi:PREDICTED: uncharacterized protein LOC108365594 [Rhagoletis zephyria]|uniref:uncharacterized protein LOC108365594 n=1 Tax=Rhagoletis zephyria TaxID=28612 RepID=UPI0008116831|nr:PREDICTED: uncharacterized protein LOC108365594 [Rhagoletis zephyria]
MPTNPTEGATVAPSSKVATLKQQRSIARRNITRIKNRLESSTASWNAIDSECRLEILNSYIKQIMAFQTEIEKEDPSDDKRGDIEELCISCKSKLMQLLGDYKQRDSSLMENTFSFAMPQSSRLPKLRLPTFDGKYADYKNFISSFNNLVNSVPHLAVIEKFNHLLSCLSGDALRTVKAFQVTEDNYSKVLDRLAERYDKKALIFFDNVERLFEIPKITKPNPSALRNAVDTVSAVYDSLLSLGTEKDITNALIIYLVLSKVDPATKSKWNDNMDYSTLPSWDTCSKLLIRRCQSLEVNEDRASKNDSATVQSTTRPHSSKPNKFNNNKNEHKASFTVANANNDNQCTFCTQISHSIYTCNAFAALPVANRFDFVKKGGYCINCLKSGHSVRNCNRSQCRICRRSHHSLLHRYKVQANNCSNTTLSLIPSNPAAAAASAAVQESNQSSSHHVSSTNDVVVLATAMVKIKDRFGKTLTVRALLDSGSQVNFISEECAHNLQLKRQYKDLSLSGIGEINANLKHKVAATVKSRVTDFEFQAEFWVIKSISGYQPEVNLPVETWQIPENIELADTDFNKRLKIDLLIGADIFFELLCLK